MKKTIISVLSFILVFFILSASLFTGTFALVNSASDLRAQVTLAINELDVTVNTTADDIVSAVINIDPNAETTWKIAFTKILPTDGAIITLNGEEVDGGVVRGHEGSIKGILNVASGDKNFDVAVDFTLEPSYETIDCAKQATVYMQESSYYDEANYDTDADLVVVSKPDSGVNYNVPQNYFYNSKDDQTIKAVIFEYGLANCLGNAFYRTRALQAVIFKNVSNIRSNAFYASTVKYVDFGSKDATLLFDVNSFAWTKLKNLYIGGYNGLTLQSNAFQGASSMQQIVIDVDSSVTVASGAINTHSSGSSSVTTAVCNNATVASVLDTAGAMATVDISTTPIVDYYSKVSAIKVIDEVDAVHVAAVADALDTDNAYTKSVVNINGMFKVSITDANSVTVFAYIDTFTSDNIKTNIDTILDKYSYEDTTTQIDINTCLQNVLGDDYTITWLENYSMSAKVNGAEVWARANEESDYSFYGKVPGQDNAVHGSFVIRNNNTCILFELNKVLEKAIYEKYELTGIQTTYGGDNGTEYNGTAELIIATSTINYRHLDGTVIDSVLDGSYSQNIKAVIVRGTLSNWNCFANLSGLEVAIIENTSITELGRQQFKNCSNLKYVYLPDNITTTKDAQSSNTQTAFYGCTSLKTVLVGPNFDRNTFIINNVNIKANVATRYAANADATKLVKFYNEISGILSAATSEELREKIDNLPSYDEGYMVDVELKNSEFIVTINDLFVVNIPVTTPLGIKKNIVNYLSSNIATNDTTENDILNAVLDISGVESVEWDAQYGFEKILATNGAQITLNGVVVDGGIVKGHYGSITGIVTVTTTFGDTFDVKVNITIDPTYETIDCSKSATVTINSDYDTYSTSAGYNSLADLVIIKVASSGSNIPANYFGATSANRNNKIKAVIVRNEVSTVLENAFQYTSALEAVVFKNVNTFNTYAFWVSGLKYIDFGSSGGNFTISNANVFAYCSRLNNLYIEDRNAVTIRTGAFTACGNVKQVYVDSKSINRIDAGVFNTNSDGTSSITTVVCNGEEAVSVFEDAGALAVINAGKRTASVYDVNNDFDVNIIDLVKYKKSLFAQSDDTTFDINKDGQNDDQDLKDMVKILLGFFNSRKDEAIIVGKDTRVSAAKTVSKFGNYTSLSDNQADSLRAEILNSKDTISVSGTTYYIANNGNDVNSGTSPDEAWRTLDALTRNNAVIKSGDAVLFKRGDIFRGRLETKSGVSYGAYGSGVKPSIYGSKMNYANETWVRTENKNIYAMRVDIKSDIGMIVFDHGEAYGYKMLNSVSECNNDYEFYHDINAGILYLYCSSGRPNEEFYDIELLYNTSIIYVPNNVEDVYIENICAKYTGGHGISVGMPVNNVTIKNCEVGWIGGSIYNTNVNNVRYGNGIQFYGQTTNAVVDHCWVYQCYDAGLTHQYGGRTGGTPEMTAENISYINNLVEFCSYSLEYFWGWSENGVQTYNPDVYMKDILVKDNIMRFAGYGLGQTRPDPINMGHIVTWVSSYNPVNNFVVESNIFDMSALRLFYVSTHGEVNPTFTGNTYIQSVDKVLGISYTENRTKGGAVEMNADALHNFDSTGTLTIIE